MSDRTDVHQINYHKMGPTVMYHVEKGKVIGQHNMVYTQLLRVIESREFKQVFWNQLIPLRSKDRIGGRMRCYISPNDWQIKQVCVFHPS